jgi:predicted dehydrogenase
MSADRLDVGVVGVCGGYGRGRHLTQLLQRIPAIRVQALCDIDRDGLRRDNQALGVARLFFTFEEMLDQVDLDAVVIATPMPFHVPQSMAALARGLHVLCEVTAAVSIDECRALVAACRDSEAIYMLAENMNYAREVVAVRELVKRGAFGTPYYCEGGYVGDAKDLARLTPWRRRWQLGINGIPYITHNLGPMLQWMPGERVEAVCCAGAGFQYDDPEGRPYEAEATCTMLGRTTSGRQVVIRSDFLSNRPPIGVYNDLQGTDGSYASARSPHDPGRGWSQQGPPEPHRIWLKSRSATPVWEDLDAIAGDVLPHAWTTRAPDGPSGAYDSLLLDDFVRAIREEIPVPIGIHEAMDMTVPGLASQQSIANGGEWIDVPDSRTW